MRRSAPRPRACGVANRRPGSSAAAGSGPNSMNGRSSQPVFRSGIRAGYAHRRHQRSGRTHADQAHVRHVDARPVERRPRPRDEDDCDRRHHRRRGDRPADEPPAAWRTAAARPAPAGAARTAAGCAGGDGAAVPGKRRAPPRRQRSRSPARPAPAATGRGSASGLPRAASIFAVRSADQLLDAGPVRRLRLQPQVVAVQLARARAGDRAGRRSRTGGGGRARC